MKIDIWSDIVCPFCVIGKRHLELALENFEHADDVEIVWHSYELDPSIEREPGRTLVDTIATKYGISAEQSAVSNRAHRPQPWAKKSSISVIMLAPGLATPSG